MKEITVTYTAEVTRVYHLSDFYAEDFMKTMQKRGVEKTRALLKHEMSADHVNIKDLYLWKRSHTLDGAAVKTHVGARTAKRYHSEFVRLENL